MAKIKVELSAFYGYGHGGCSYGSNDTIEVEVNDQELDALRKLGDEKVSCEAVVEAIENGETVLQSLHEKLEEEFYYMVEEYWLYEADNECLYECLAEHIEQDIEDGLYAPSTSEDEDDSLDYDEDEDEDEGDEDSEDEDSEDEDDFEDEDYDDEDDEGYDLDAYYDWVCGNGHDHDFVAERVGLDLDACRDDAVDYTILL